MSLDELVVKHYRIVVSLMVFGSLLLGACGRTSLPNTEPILRPQESRNQPITAVVVPTTTVDLTATILDQTAIVEGATEEAEYLAVEQRFADETRPVLLNPIARCFQCLPSNP